MRTYKKGFILVSIYALLSHIYFVVRFSGRWIEEDTGRMAKFAEYVQAEATMLPSAPVYPNGPGFSILLTGLSGISGISISSLTLFFLPILGALPVLVSYLIFHEITKSARLAILSAFLLSLQPDFLLTSSRGTHEKFTYTLLLLSFFFLARSFSRMKNIREFAINVLLFYITILGMISYNFFFSATYVFASVVALIIGYFVSQFPQAVMSFKRLVYTSSTSTVFFFSYMFYLYTPSRNLLYVFDTLADKIGAIALATEEHVTPQYQYIFQWWISFETWLFLTLFNWVIALLSFSAWVFLVYRFFIRKHPLGSSMQLLLMFYTAFSLQLLITIFADRFGVFNNLELRVFPVLMFFAVPLAAFAIFALVRSHRIGPRHRKSLKVLFSVLLLIFVVNSLLKATNDPLVSNKWFFYSIQERDGLMWAQGYLHEQSMWADIDARLISVYNIFSDVDDKNVKFTSPRAEYWYVTELIEKRAITVRYPMPYLEDKSIIYDSGGVRIYRNE